MPHPGNKRLFQLWKIKKRTMQLTQYYCWYNMVECTLGNHGQITFVMLNGFCPLSKNTYPPCS